MKNLQELDLDFYDVTVVIVSYNHSSFIEQCLESVCCQLDTNIQLIVIDNFSSDDSISKIEKWKNKYKFETIYNDKNIGLPAALNQALKISKGEFFTAIAADDVMLNGRLKVQLDFLKNNPSFYACSGGQLKIDDFNRVLPFFKQRNLIDEMVVVDEKILFTQTNFVYSPTLMSRTTELIHDGGYKEDIFIEDLYMLYKCSTRGLKLAVLPYLFTLYRMHSNNSHTKYLWMHEQKMKILNEFSDSLYRKDLQSLILAESFYSLAAFYKLKALRCLKSISLLKSKYFYLGVLKIIFYWK